MLLKLEIFQYGLNPVDFGISRKTVTIAPHIDPNGLHTGV